MLAIDSQVRTKLTHPGTTSDKLVTLVANCYLIAGLAFLVYMARRAYLVMTAAPPPPDPAAQDDEASLTGVRTNPG